MQKNILKGLLYFKTLPRDIFGKVVDIKQNCFDQIVFFQSCLYVYF